MIGEWVTWVEKGSERREGGGEGKRGLEGRDRPSDAILREGKVAEGDEVEEYNRFRKGGCVGV